jgi:hypothetical protein
VGLVEVAGERVSLVFSGTHESQADLLAGLIAAGFRVTSCEERKSSFEDLLITVAEQNT